MDSFIGSGLPRRSEKSAVTSTFASQSLIRSLTASAEKPAEDDRVGRADARAGQHRRDGLGDHRQVDRDAVVALHAEALQDVGEPLRHLEQVRVGDRARSPSSPSQW